MQKKELIVPDIIRDIISLYANNVPLTHLKIIPINNIIYKLYIYHMTKEDLALTNIHGLIVPKT